MVDLELRFVDKLINETTLRARLFLGCTCVLFSAAVLLFFISVIKPTILPFEKTIPAAFGIFSPTPLFPFFMARSKRVALTFLKERWQDAQARKDILTIEKLRTRFEELQNEVLEKGLGAFQ